MTIDTEKLCKLKENLAENLVNYAGRTNFSNQEVELIRNMSSAIKNLCKICDEEEMGSQRGGSRMGSRRSYDGGSSNRGGNYRGDYVNPMEEDGSYHGGREWAIRELEDLRSRSGGPDNREAWRRIMEIVKQM